MWKCSACTLGGAHPESQLLALQLRQRVFAVTHRTGAQVSHWKGCSGPPSGLSL